MVTLDPEQYDVVGIVTQMGLTQNAIIKGIGLSDRQSGEFVPIPFAERNRTFPKRGSVFAPNYFKNNSHLKNECVCLSVQPNNNPNIVNGEDFVWDWRNKTYIYADRINNLTTPLSEDGGINYNILFKAGFLPCDRETYFIGGDTIYRIEPGKRLLSYWKLSDVTSDNLLTYNGIYYILNNLTQAERGKIDLTSDEQLIEWYKKNILKKEWNIIYESKDFKSVDNIVTEELKNLKIPSNVYKSRLGRVLSLNENVSLTFEELEDLSTSSWFSDIILNTIKSFSDHYIEKVEKDRADEIADLERRYKHQIEDLLNKINKKKDELNTLDNTIKEKGQEIERLDSRKQSIIEDFSIIKDVLSLQQPHATVSSDSNTTICTFGDDDKMAFPTVGPYRKNIEALLMNQHANKVVVDEIITKLAAHYVVLFPDDRTLLATMQATGRCRYAVSYVGVDWKSFNNLMKSGLGAIVSEALGNPDMIHFLILRNINMSFIPCYFQPILDMQTGLVTTFPNTSIEFPENLRILCTRAKDSVIPVTEYALKGLGCICPSEERYTGTEKTVNGFLPVSVFSDLPRIDQYTKENAYDSYTDE